MRRRKLLIGIGAAAAGGSAAFGTEAFTSVQAERNVDVSVAGDQSSFVALTSTDSANAERYVSFEGDGTLEININGDNGSGSGVTNDAITTLEDLFAILNQGSQSVNIHVDDSSDAVTFQSAGGTIETVENSVELDVGEEIIVGIEVDTLNNDFDVSKDSSTNILDNATIVADASNSGPVGPNPAEFDLVLDSSLSTESTGTDEFTSLSSALTEATEGDTIGIREGSGDYASESTQTINTKGVSLVGPNAGTHGASASRDAEATLGSSIEIAADDVTINGIEIDGAEGNAINMTRPVSDVTIQNNRIVNVVDTGFDQSGGVDAAANGVNAQLGGSNLGQPGDTMANLAIRDNEISGFSISANDDGDDEVTATGVRLNQKDKNVEDPVISGNVITNITASNSSSGTIEARGITVNAATATGSAVMDGLTIDSNEISNLSATGGSSTGIGIFENSGPDLRPGPKNFEIVANEFKNLSQATIEAAESEVNGAIFVGGYETLGSNHRVENNNFRSGQVARFGAQQNGFEPNSADALDVENNFYGASSGPKGNDGVGGSGVPANTVNKDGKVDNNLVAADDGGNRTSEVPFAGPDI